MEDIVTFTGTISSTTSDSRSAVVRLDSPVKDLDLAVITPSTRGRIRAMNGVGGLRADTRVSGSATVGIDALNVVEVQVERS